MSSRYLIFWLLGSTALADTITVVTRNAPTTFFYAADGTRAGFEYEMITAFAEAHGHQIQLTVRDSTRAVIETLERGEADIAAAGLSRTDGRAEAFFMSPGYFDVTEQVVCGEGIRPDSVEALQGLRLQIAPRSSYGETLRTLKQTHPALSWREDAEFATERLFERIRQKQLDCTVADSNVVALNRRYFPRLQIAFDIGQTRQLVWMLPKSPKTYPLYNAITPWILKFVKSKRFERIRDRYYALTFDATDITVYHRRIKERLPKYIDSFRRGGQKYGIDWRLLAAQAYQESHWDPAAKSPTGVRGMMMLTQATAKELGVTNRLNYRHSIEGGAKYLQQLTGRIPDGVTGALERRKFALAAYNVGMAHLHDAMTLARKLGKNPYIWSDLKSVLPLLAERKYHATLRYGYARGMEAVHYVSRVMNYFDILMQHYKSG